MYFQERFNFDRDSFTFFPFHFIISSPFSSIYQTVNVSYYWLTLHSWHKKVYTIARPSLKTSSYNSIKKYHSINKDNIYSLALYPWKQYSHTHHQNCDSWDQKYPISLSAKWRLRCSWLRCLRNKSENVINIYLVTVTSL